MDLSNYIKEKISFPTNEYIFYFIFEFNLNSYCFQRYIWSFWLFHRILYKAFVAKSLISPQVADQSASKLTYQMIHWCAKKMAPVQKKWHLLQKKCHLLQKKCHPFKKSNSHNIKLYDFYLNIIHFILKFYNKYLVVV